MSMYIDANTIISASAVLAAVLAVGGTLLTCYRWVLKQNRRNTTIEEMKKENALICYGLSAALDGLIQLGANHTVPIAREELEKHLNKAAHDIRK